MNKVKEKTNMWKKIKKLGGEVKCKSLMSNDDHDGITPPNPKKSKRW